MRTVVALLLVLASSAFAGDAPGKPAPKAELDRPTSERKPGDGKVVCVYADRDQNAPSQRGDCISEREPIAQRPVEKSPPGGPGGDSTPSVR